ncbi:MAG: type IV toxin-antitoxin system AbiEi family antitoxin domain-containing protein [Kineosporiaceae bacterium]
MHARLALSETALALARSQSGVLSRRQLHELGVTRRTQERLTGEWRRLGRGVYLIGPAAGEVPWAARVWAGIVLGGPHARAGLRTAAVLDGLASLEEPGGRAGRADEIVILVSGRVGPHPGYAFIRERPGVRLPSSGREPPRTRIEDTVVDLCADADEASVVMWLTRACQRRLTTPNRLRERVGARAVARRRGLVLQILDDVAAGATSNLEQRALHEVFRPHGLPAVRLQHRTGSGNRIADAAFVAYRVLIELDGRVGHVEEGAFRDRTRDNVHTLDGWATLRFGWFDITAAPCAAAAQIGHLLTVRGWPGPFTPCPRCPPGVVAG